MSKTISVSQLTQSIKNTLETDFFNISVEGEISNYKEHSSGHRYFTLKDNNAQISCTMWKARQLGFQPKDGMKAIISGSLTVYPPRGNYQIDVASMLPAGEGDLFIAFEALKQKLASLGYFAQERKRPLPNIPLNIGISTSPTGAAKQDMLTTIKRRFPCCNIFFRPTLVQGDGAAEDIVHSIYQLQQTEAEVIIIGRGGGSIEDLWAFNMEIVADAIFNSKVPIISAVGHETDFTIADFVADLRAATPTAAAEIVTPYPKDELLAELSHYFHLLGKLIKNNISKQKDNLGVAFGKHLAKMTLDRIKMYNQTVDSAEISFQRAINQKLANSKSKNDTLQKLLTSFHPLSPLDRGFAVLRWGNELIKPDVSLSQFKKIELLRKMDSSVVKIEKVYPPDIFMVNQNEK